MFYTCTQVPYNTMHCTLPAEVRYSSLTMYSTCISTQWSLYTLHYRQKYTMVYTLHAEVNNGPCTLPAEVQYTVHYLLKYTMVPVHCTLPEEVHNGPCTL